MARITVEDCLTKIPNRFQLVLAATYRARMLSQGHSPRIESKNKPGVTALRGKDEFHLVIPYVRFVPHEVDVPLVVVDTSVLIDGRVARVCESGFLTAALVIPRFVLNELRAVADSADPHKQARGRRSRRRRAVR